MKRKSESEIQELAKRLVEIAVTEQRDKHGQFAEESKIKAGAKATLRYLITEGFADLTKQEVIEELKLQGWRTDEAQVWYAPSKYTKRFQGGVNLKEAAAAAGITSSEPLEG